MTLLLRTAKVCLLKLCDLLIVDRERSTAVTLLAHEVELRRRLMTTLTRRPQQEIDDVVVSPISDLGAGLRNLQCKKLPSVRFGELHTRVLHHGFKRHQLEDGANRILLVRLTLAEDPHRFLQLLRIFMLEACISDFRPLQNAPKVLLRNSDILSQGARRHGEAKPDCK